MHTEWSVECGAEDPVLVVPWEDTTGKSAFVDLRGKPGEVDAIPEAQAHPPLMQAIHSFNASRSPIFTAKCDAWEMGADEIAQLRLDLAIGLDLNEADSDPGPAGSESDSLRFGFASYIDCIVRDRALFASFPRHEHLLRAIARLAAQLDHPHAAVECVLRPAFVHLDAPRQGHAFSVYVKTLAASPQQAWKRWAAALSDVTALLRRNDVVR